MCEPLTAEDRTLDAELELSAAEAVYLALAWDHLDDLSREEKDTTLQCGYRLLQTRKRLERSGPSEDIWLAARNCRVRLEAILLRVGNLDED